MIPRRFASLTLAALLVFAGDALADDGRGPAFGSNRYATEIRSGPDGADTDEYVSDLVLGETLAVRAVSPFQSPLLPTLTLLDPNGVERAPAVVSARGGQTVFFKNFAIDVTGAWTVRVGAILGTQGKYTVAFKVKKAPARVAKGQALGGVGPELVGVPIEATDGALATIIVKWAKGRTPVEIASLRDPSGAHVPGEVGTAASAAKVSKRKAVLKKVELRNGSGTYQLDLSVPPGESSVYDLKVVVVPQGRPKRRKPKQLSSDEPFLEERFGPIEAVAGRTIRLVGKNMRPGTRVFFGGIAAPETLPVNEFGTAFDALVPVGTPGSIVDVTLEDRDGQVYRRPGYFFYVPPATVTDLTDLNGVRVVGGSTAGGARLQLHGSDFRTGQFVNFGNSIDVIPVIRSSSLMEITSPAVPNGGFVDVIVRDVYDGEGILPFQYEYKFVPEFAADPYSPSLVQNDTSTVVQIAGDHFEFDDVVLVDGAAVAGSHLTDKLKTFQMPALPDGLYTIAIRDRFGVVFDGPQLRVKGPASIDDIEVTDGATFGVNRVALVGGAHVSVTGSQMHPSDVITLAGSTLAVSEHDADGFEFIVPAGTSGDAELVMTDAFQRTTTVSDALRFVGFTEETASRTPGAGATDDLGGVRGAVGDLDGDGDADDLVLVSDGPYSPGTRSEFTRIFFGDAYGKLADKTAANFPAAYSDANQADAWVAGAVALGDLDGQYGTDIVIGGTGPYYYDVRLFTNDGYGDFSHDETYGPGAFYVPSEEAKDENGVTHSILSARTAQGVPTAIVIGDLDDDGDDEIIVSRDSYDYAYAGIDPAYVDFTQTPAYVTAADAAAYVINEYRYYAALRILDNDGAYGFVDVSDVRLPSAGTSPGTVVPALHGEDVAIGDLDDDDDLDIVLTWSDPTTVSAYGLYKGSGTDSTRTATRVLENDGYGYFTDDTSSWMPSGGAQELWQAHRCVLADLDADDDLDLLLIHALGVDAFEGTPRFQRHALRVLRNDGATTGFTDITLTALPALPTDSNDNLRGNTLLVRDVDADGVLDILVGTTEGLVDLSSKPIRSTRLLLGNGDFSFRLASDFLPAVGTDSGQVQDLLSGDFGSADPALILVSDTAPSAGPSGEKTRVFDWHR